MPRARLADQALSAPRSFRIVMEPDGGGWHVFAPDVQGCRSWGRSLAEARTRIREALATCVDVLGDDAASVARAARLEETVKVPATVRRALQRYERGKAAIAKGVALEREAARGLDGLSLRDAGELLGVSAEQVRRLRAG